jgi:2-oxoacid dehydrogenases acyltransferase (catalytic domain)
MPSTDDHLYCVNLMNVLLLFFCLKHQVPDVNASWMETFVRQFHSVDINLFVNTKEGLVTPILKDVGGRGLKAIADEVITACIRRIHIHTYL